MRTTTTAVGALVAAVVLALAMAAAAEARPGDGKGRGNSWAAHRCQHGGYRMLVGSDGTTFRSVGACVRFAAHGGVFSSGATVNGIVIPPGKVATIWNAHWNLAPCDALVYGYQLDLGALVPLASKPGGSCTDGSLPGATIGPFSRSVALRIFLRDAGDPATPVACDYTFYSNGPHALVTGSGPWQVDIRDSDFCTKAPDTAFAPPGPGLGNLDLEVTVS